MRIHFVIHESFESAGTYLPWAESRNHEVSWTHVYASEPVPANADSFDMLVVFGGPQSPRTTLAECPYFDSLAEQELAEAKGRLFIRSVEEMRAHDYREMNQKLWAFLDKLTL